MCTLPAMAESPVKTNLSTSFPWHSAWQHLLWTFQQYDSVQAKKPKKSTRMFCSSLPPSPCCSPIAGDWHSTAQLVAAHITPQLVGGQGDPGLLFLLAREHSSSRFGGEAEGNPLCRFLARQPRAALCSPEELHSQRPGIRDLGQPILMSWPFLPSSSLYHPVPQRWLLLFAISQAVPSKGLRAECFV